VDDALAREVARSLRGGESFSIALFAVDAASDERFCRAASLLRSTARRDDLVARVDRLRLAAILSGAREEQALAFCRRFAGELRRVEAEGARSVVSAGVAAYDAGKTPRDVLGEAAAHLAEATRRGGNCAVAPR
jgi:GGDEF domain-containing protein